MNNAVFGKTMENVRKRRDIKLVTIDKRRNQLVLERKYPRNKIFFRKLFSNRNEKKNKIKNESAGITWHNAMSILDISKTLIYEFRYDYIQQKNQNKAKLYCLNTESFIIYIKTEDFDKDIDVEKWFDTSNYSKYNKRPLPISMNKTVIELPKVELGEEIVKEFVTLRAKSFLLNG